MSSFNNVTFLLDTRRAIAKNTATHANIHD
jgi:hypothetical protein